MIALIFGISSFYFIVHRCIDVYVNVKPNV